MTDQNEHGIANFAALKTSIVNGEEQSVKQKKANVIAAEAVTCFV